jgi:hypothetical protein
MTNLSNITDEEHVLIGRQIENFFAFTRDVLDDPSILDQIPNDAHVAAIPIEERVPGQRYDVETPHTVAIVTPPAAPRARTAAPKRGLADTSIRRRKPAHRVAGQFRDAFRQRDARRFRLTVGGRPRP